jgi:hypothetical protein
MLAMEFQIAISEHGAWEQPRFKKDLKTVANAKHWSARRGEAPHRVHHGREPRDGASAQVIPMREAARKNHDVGTVQVGFFVPDERGVLSKHLFGGMEGVVIAIRSRKDDNGELHNSLTWL